MSLKLRLPSPVSIVLSATLWRSAAMLFLSFVLGSLWWGVLLLMLSLGIGNAVLWIGLPLLLGAMLLWRVAAQCERRRIEWLLGISLPAPYHPLADGTRWQRAFARIGDATTWRDLLYLVLLFPMGVVELFLLCIGLLAPLCLLALPVYYQSLPTSGRSAHMLWPGITVAGWPEALLIAGLGLVWLVPGACLVVGTAALHGKLARALLGEPAARQVALIAASRQRLLTATLLERRRIERELHDGIQQQLVSLALDLGMAKEKVLTQPEQAQALVAQAHDKAKQAIAELRDVVHGIYPAILTDRGLEAALTTLADNSPLPVALVVEWGRSGAPRERLPEVVEMTAYYLVAEALTNVAKHSQATAAEVHVRRERGRLLIAVRDDGIGGADASRGSGLSGLIERFAALGGRIAVTSPVGGPTCIQGDLPCGW